MSYFDKFINMIVTACTLLPFTGATWFLLGIMFFFVMIFAKANHNPRSPIHWEDLLIDTITGKTSPYKLGYLIGVIVGTWVTITLTDRNKLTFDILSVYLAFLLGGAGWTAFVTNKFGNGGVPAQETKVVVKIDE